MRGMAHDSCRSPLLQPASSESPSRCASDPTLSGRVWWVSHSFASASARSNSRTSVCSLASLICEMMSSSVCSGRSAATLASNCCCAAACNHASLNCASNGPPTMLACCMQAAKLVVRMLEMLAWLASARRSAYVSLLMRAYIRSASSDLHL